MFSKNMRAAYLYTACFITLMMVIAGVIATVYAVASYHFDEPTQWNSVIHQQRAIINSIAVWAIAAPIFALHWWQVVKFNKKKEVAQNVVGDNDSV